MIELKNDEDYRELIKAEFQKRRTSDPFYSLRKYANDLGLKTAHLSYLFKNKRGLSKGNALRIARALGLKSFAAERFRFLVSAQSGRSSIERNAAKQGLKRKWVQQAEKELRARLNLDK